MTKSEAFSMVHRIEDFNWKKYGLTVQYDGYNENGTRIHFVKESGFNGELVGNAYIFSV